MIKAVALTKQHNEHALNFDGLGNVLPSGIYAFEVSGGVPVNGPVGPFPSKRKARRAGYYLWIHGSDRGRNRP